MATVKYGTSDVDNVMYESSQVDKLIMNTTQVWPESAPFPSTDLIAYYRMDTNSGTTAYDAVGTVDGTVGGTSTWETGKHNYCLLMDAGNDGVVLGNNFGFERTDPFSFACWFKRTGTGTDNYIWAKYDGVAIKGIVLQINTSDQMVMNLIGRVNPTIKMISITTVTTYTDTSNWYHWAVTYDGSSAASGLKLYINGSYVTSRTISQDNLNISIVNTSDAKIGQSAAVLNPYKYMDEFGIWDAELTASEISDLYNSGDGIFY